MTCNHIPRNQKENYCPVCGQPTNVFAQNTWYTPPTIGPVARPVYEYQYISIWDNGGLDLRLINDLCQKGWRVVCTLGGDGRLLLLEKQM